VPHQATPFSEGERRCALPFVDAYEDAPDGRDGFLRGTLTDAHGEPAIGATVVATGRALVGEQVAISDESGAYQIGALPPGRYELTVYYENRVGSHPITIYAGVLTIDHVHDAEKGCAVRTDCGCGCGPICDEPAPVPIF
jgi:hypothetical protein